METKRERSEPFSQHSALRSIRQRANEKIHQKEKKRKKRRKKKKWRGLVGRKKENKPEESVKNTER